MAIAEDSCRFSSISIVAAFQARFIFNVVLPHSWGSSSISLHPRPSKSPQLIETQWDVPSSLQKVKRQLSEAAPSSEAAVESITWTPRRRIDLQRK
jgi:hypothetical protein